MPTTAPRTRRVLVLLLAMTSIVAPPSARADATSPGDDDEAEPTARALAEAVERAWRAGDSDEASRLCDEAVRRLPEEPLLREIRARLRSALGRHSEAVEDLEKLVELAPRSADTWDELGSERFKAAEFTAAVQAFDRAVELDPRRGPWHWRRGIAMWYAGEFGRSRRQFESYQGVDGADVENAAWRWLAMASAEGAERATKEILQVGPDRRVPMREVWRLLAGEIGPDAVLAAARAGEATEAERSRRLFYAHLYVGLWRDARGDEKGARRDLELAAKRYAIEHWMGHVPRAHLVHLDRRAAERTKAEDRPKDSGAAARPPSTEQPPAPAPKRGPDERGS